MRIGFQKSVFKVLKYFLLILFIFGCNTSVIDFEDNFYTKSNDTIPIVIDTISHTFLSSLNPKFIHDYAYYPSDTNTYIEYKFNYNNTLDTIKSIYYNGSPWYFLKYESNKIIRYPAGGSNPALIATLKNNKIDSLTGFAWTTHYIYDARNYLVSRVNSHSTISYQYLAGNLIETTELCDFEPFDNIKVNYQYNDTIILSKNANFFPFTGYDFCGNYGNDVELRYLNIFGRQNKNLITTLTRSKGSFAPYTLNFIWSIQDSKINSLYIKHDSITTRKIVYIY